MADSHDIPGRRFYHAADPKDIDYSVNTKPAFKFPKKFLIWQAIDENGNASSPYICTSTMTGDVYLNECLNKRLIPFIKQYHEIESVFVWPDLASSHYSKEVIAYLREENVDFVQKQANPPNVPQDLKCFGQIASKHTLSERIHP